MRRIFKKKGIYLSGLLLCITLALGACIGTGATAGSSAQETQTAAESSTVKTEEAAQNDYRPCRAQAGAACNYQQCIFHQSRRHHAHVYL